ncbi:PKD domain-containing protein [Tenacibaculum piscium]|uniref:collagenase n=1 Tax=Tenacibaculum piscium TaxID=1458515 RepID=UPI00187B9F40|nr:collagenase [Tenacibaculum piscium]MBE7685236.1 PKD domain-containing protein [Tenacibaculum piscium]
MIFSKKTFQKQAVALLTLCYSYGFSQQAEPALPKSKVKETVACTKGYSHKNHNEHASQNRMARPDSPSTFAAWASYGGADLVRELKEATDYDTNLRPLFDYGQYGGSLFSSANVKAVADAVYNISVAYDGRESSGMLGMVTYLHCAGYHEFFQAEITLDANAKTAYKSAVQYLAKNPRLWDNTEYNLGVLDEFLIMCDYDGIRDKDFVLDVIKTAIRNLTENDTWREVVDNQQMLTKYISAYNRIFFLMFRGMQPVDIEYEASLNNDPEFLQLLSDLATDTELRDENEDLALMVNNAIGEMTRTADNSDVLKDQTEPFIAEIAQSYERLTPNWYKSIKSINESGNCAKYNLCENMDEITAEVEAMLFPNTWTFDDGRLKVRTPLDYKTVQELYYASKQVQTQFFRALETDEPVTGDINVNLNMVVYGTMKNYHDWQTILNGLATNNGGMYIERGATFYTYQRTYEESTFSLEELFRHEYVHYLQGRYIANGSWGESDFYKDGRLIWFEEGMAEHFAGSTDNDGVRIRESQGSSVKNEGASEYMTVNEVLNASYAGGFKFYRYGNMLWSYWFKNDINTARKLINLVRADDIAAFDTEINRLESSWRLESDFKNYLNNVVIDENNWWEVVTPWEVDDFFVVGNIADIETEFEAITGKDVTVTLDASTSIRRFKVTGSLTSGQFETELNELMTQLKESPTVNNFDYIGGYYKEVSGSNATFVITGSLRDATVSDAPVADFSSDLPSTIVGGSIQFTNESTGYINSYTWSFPGGTPSTSTEKNPTVVYGSPGNYDVTLTVTSAKSGNNTRTKNTFIKVHGKSDTDYCPISIGTKGVGIHSVKFSNLDNEDFVYNEERYSDYTSYAAEVNLNKTYPIAIKAEIASWDKNNIKAWIDWNQDGDFEDAEEEVYAHIGAFKEGSVTVPSNAVLGVTRMRVRYGYDKEVFACGEDSYFGEVEDYSVIVGIEASTITWTGNTSTDFTDITNWNTNTVPTSYDDVIIPAGLTKYPVIETPTEVKTITIASGATLIANAELTGTVTYTRNLPTDNWYLIASPLKYETIERLNENNSFASGTGTNIGFASYNNDGTVWNYLSNNSKGNITSAQGYSVKLNGASNLVFTGNINSTAVNYGITKNVNDFNLIGNPYTSYVKLGDFFKDNATGTVLSEATIWLWNQATNSYDLKLGTADANYQIAPGQGFFVSAAANTNVTFSKENQSHQSDTFQRQAKTEINLSVSENNTVKSTKLYYIDGTTTGFDNGYDGTVFGGTITNYELYTQLVSDNNGKNYAVQSLPTNNLENTIVPIGLKVRAGKKVEFSVKTTNLPENIIVYLEDKENNTFTNLSEGNYTVTVTKDATEIGQFYLHTKSKRLDANQNIASLNKLAVYKSSNSTVTITGLEAKKARVILYSIQGKQVFSTEIKSKENATVNLPKLASGIYLVKIISEIGEVNKKIIL